MKKGSAALLQAVIVLIGLGALIFLLGEPHLEGRNATATLFEIYFKDPFLAYAYIASIAFFMGLYQIFKLVDYARQNKIFTPTAAKALRTVKYCALAIIVFVIGGEVFLLIGNTDDRPPVIVMGSILILVSTAVALAAARYEKLVTKKI